MVGLVVALAVVACEDPNLGRGIVAENRTDVPLTFVVEAGNERITLSRSVDPGERTALIGGSGLGEHSRVARNGCAIGDVVAIDPDGREVARHPPPFCVGDTWVVSDA